MNAITSYTPTVVEIYIVNSCLYVLFYVLVLLSFAKSISGRCCLDGSSIYQPMFIPLSSHPTLYSTSFSQDRFSICWPSPLLLWPFTFLCSINFSSVWCLLYVRNNLIFAFNIYSSSGVFQMLCFCLGSTFHIRMWQLEICMFVLSVNSYTHGIFLVKQAL